MIQVQDVHKKYGRVHALKGVSFEVQRGETFGIIGPNGAGKTTLLKILLGLVHPDQGSMVLDGVDLVRSPVEARRRMGYVPQYAGFDDQVSGRDALRFFAKLRGVDPTTVDESASAAGVLELLDRPVGTFSGGQKQRLSLAAALLGEPSILLLDEPTASLDPQATAQFRALVTRLSAAGRTILFSSHLLGDVERLCHRTLVLLEGKVAALEDLRGGGDRQDRLEDRFLATVEMGS